MGKAPKAGDVAGQAHRDDGVFRHTHIFLIKAHYDYLDIIFSRCHATHILSIANTGCPSSISASDMELPKLASRAGIDCAQNSLTRLCSSIWRNAGFLCSLQTKWEISFLSSFSTFSLESPPFYSRFELVDAPLLHTQSSSNHLNHSSCNSLTWYYHHGCSLPKLS